MSGSLKYFVNNDGTQVLFDPSSGKYYTMILDDQLEENVNQQHQTLNQSRGNRSSVKSSSQQSNGTVVQNNLKYQQKQQTQATTWQKNSEQNTSRTSQKTKTIALTEQTSTTRETEQVLEENRKKNEDNGTDTQMMSENFQRQEQAKEMSSTLKHQATSEIPGNDTNEHWETVQPRGNNKRMNTGNDIVYRQQPRTFSNSNQNNSVNLDGRQQHQLHSPSHNSRNYSSSLSNQQQTTNGGNQLPITDYALEYASNYHFSPFKLECQPKIRDRKDGTKLINDLIKFITPGFLIQNPRFSHDILFDLWWIDPDGNIEIIIKTTDLYVFLCKLDRYPNQLNNVAINPIPPTHLPPQHTAIIKWVNNSFTDDDVRDELNMKFESLFSIASMQGTINERNRHIKVEMLNKNEYNKLLNSGKINLGGQLYSVDEYLPAPRILICNRCNLPGHTKKSCRNSDVDLCRRCGKSRTNIEEHKDCEIKCHHCQENHLATDYKCKIIDKYRRELIEELKKHPERMPPEVQLFIPSGYRSDDRRKMIYNEEAYHQNQYVQQQQQFYNRSDENAWPGLRATSAPTTTADGTNNINEAIKTLSEELKEEKKRHEIILKQIEEKHKASVQMMNQAWLLVKQVQQTQEMIVSSMS